MHLLMDEMRAMKSELETQKCHAEEMACESPGSKRKSSPEKPPLPPKYDGSTDFCTYLVQFEVLAKQHRWSAEKCGVMLLSRMKGRALDVAAQGEDLGYVDLVNRLRAHFSPEHEEMFAQKLQAIQKSATQTWEDLAFRDSYPDSKSFQNCQ